MILLRQLIDFPTFTLTYILACRQTRQAIIIDPVLEQVGRDSKLLKELDLNLIYGLNTHVHADHISGTSALKSTFPAAKSLISAKSGAKADRFLSDREVLRFGNVELEVLETPGHTNGCLTFIQHQIRAAFTGDALLIRGCGRTDFQQGDSRQLYRVVRRRILDALADDYRIFPGHNYDGLLESTVAEELKWNTRFAAKTEREFVALMDALRLPYPAQIEKAVPANLEDGKI